MNLEELQDYILEMNDKHFPGWEYQKLEGEWDTTDAEFMVNDMMHLYWTSCIAGEAGELANGCKKYIRTILGWSGKKLTFEEYKAMGEKELSDIFIYLVLYSRVLGIDLSKIVADKIEENFERFKIAEEVPRLG